MTIRAIFFDIGGVLIHEKNHDKRHEWEVRLGLSQGQLRQVVFATQAAARAASAGFQNKPCGKKWAASSD